MDFWIRSAEKKLKPQRQRYRQIPLRLQSPQFYIVKEVRVKRIHFRASKLTISLFTEWQIVRPVSSVKNARRIMRRYLTSAHAQLSKLVRTCAVAVFISADASLVPRASCIHRVQCTDPYKTICIRTLNLFKARKGHCLTDSLTDSKNREFYALFS